MTEVGIKFALVWLQGRWSPLFHSFLFFGSYSNLKFIIFTDTCIIMILQVYHFRYWSLYQEFIIYLPHLWLRSKVPLCGIYPIYYAYHIWCNITHSIQNSKQVFNSKRQQISPGLLCRWLMNSRLLCEYLSCMISWVWHCQKRESLNDSTNFSDERYCFTIICYLWSFHLLEV